MCIVVQAWECANKLGLIGPAMEQPQYNMFEREKVHMLALSAGLMFIQQQQHQQHVVTVSTAMASVSKAMLQSCAVSESSATPKCGLLCLKWLTL